MSPSFFYARSRPFHSPHLIFYSSLVLAVLLEITQIKSGPMSDHQLRLLM